MRADHRLGMLRKVLVRATPRDEGAGSAGACLHRGTARTTCRRHWGTLRARVAIGHRGEISAADRESRANTWPRGRPGAHDADASADSCRLSCNVAQGRAARAASFHPNFPSSPPAKGHSLRVKASDAGDLESPALNWLEGSSPSFGTIQWPYGASGSRGSGIDPNGPSCEVKQGQARSWRQHGKPLPKPALSAWHT